MAQSQAGNQFTLWTHGGGPNGWKVAALLNELGLTYESKFVDFQNKPAEFLAIAPNGRIPVIVDHSRNDKTLFESVAILLYIVHHYDKENRLWFTNEDEIADAHQWLLFQVSGIGPYFGQKAWFSNFHPEKVPSAIERYEKEIKRVLGVLETYLADGKEWFVGGKYSIVDINNYPWLSAVPWLLGGPEAFDAFPKTKAYVERVGQQRGVAEAYATKASLAKH
eukprot:TRINITY_DN1091_c0_g2_i1.p1 TRINITY_DN1091_c0_g2~~TRINITY_DN1091_c0_g2_i1.p1  ORF type:complete len:222 (+),score=42.10 TRINITY_DN1091_c0_g2_i1:95-760(+)